MTVPANKPDPFANLLTRQQFCDMYGVSYRTAEMMAHRGTGPRFIKLGRRAFYAVDDIASWIEAQRQKSAARFEQRAAA